MRTKALGVVALVAVSVAAGALLRPVLDRRSGEPPQVSQVEGRKPVYQCPMHPQIVSDHPGQCPICHMDLQKVEGDEAAQSAAGDSVQGRTGFTLSQEKQQLIGVATARVERRPLRSEVRATGKVAFDPELFTAIEEYRQSLFTRSQMNDSPYEGLKAQGRELVSSARTRLRLMGLSDAQISALSRGRGDAMSLLLPKGQVWVYAEVFEYEVGGLKAGQEIEVTAPVAPGQRFNGKISSISPIVSGPTRTVRVRAQVPDPMEQLRPDTFVNVKILVDFGKRLTVPEDAILHSGSTDFVFIVKGAGRFEPRQVTTGAKALDQVEVVNGLAEGEQVVSAANFLIDSESRMRNALRDMGRSAPSPMPPAGGHRHE